MDHATLRDARTTYASATLDAGELAASPFEQFARWLDAARDDDRIGEANAMTVATADGDGRPSARIVLLRGYDDRGFVFFTNYGSRKGKDIAAKPYAALLWHWEALEREVRVEGPVAPLSGPESDDYFARRPRGHRLSAWASPQSDVVPDRAALERAMAEADARFPGDVPRPPYWGGYRVAPETIEFWQGRPDRVHDRLRYRREGEAWTTERLAP